jgi:predicted aspartyl protease
VVFTSVAFCEPFALDPENPGIELQLVHFQAVWDTGATGTAITKKVADEIGLTPSGQVNVHTAPGQAIQNTYLVHVALPMGILIPNITVTESILSECDALIGMDIISLGDFSITNEDRNTIMSFRIPSMASHDYVIESNRYNKIMERKLNPRAPMANDKSKKQRRSR